MSTSELSTEENRIIVCLCCLDKPDDNYFNSFISLLIEGLLYRYSRVKGSLLPFARNKALRQVYANDPDFTHVLFIDDDMCNFGPFHLKRLLKADKDIISGLFTQRAPPFQITSAFLNKNKTLVEDIKAGNIGEAYFTGMAFTLIKKKVLDAMMEETTDGPLWFNIDRLPRDSFETEVEEFVKEKIEKYEDIIKIDIDFLKDSLLEAIAMGATCHRGSIPLGEDITFCRQARIMGFEVWVDCGCPIGHKGEKIYDYRDAFAAVNT